ncbi:DUF1365 domain-containing protein [Paracoccus ravus]|uniref:DUF1365 domain-containing protein n=1 Tax=Paracoccus ravus TaxID=2447760 RepID=UPI00106DD47E|nr:DUF1365 domain-containing protein [Paracoccus ravus]
MVIHARRGGLHHAFRAQVDHVLLAPESCRPPPLMGHNRFNLIALHDSDHGGPRGAGTGARWARTQFATLGIPSAADQTVALLTQPRFLGFWFNPVSFWLLIEGDTLRAVIAEVNNTFGQRHSYLLAEPSLAPITAGTRLRARKVFHVSPFQDVAGEYVFAFALQRDRLAIRILHDLPGGGLDAALSGRFESLGPRRILASALRRPGGALRVIAKIYWHALRLKLKGAAYRSLPAPPDKDMSR